MVKITDWVRITGGLMYRRGEVREGVADSCRIYPSGPCWRIINPDTKQNWGWINEEHLKVIPSPVYESQLPAEVQQMGLDVIMAPR